MLNLYTNKDNTKARDFQNTVTSYATRVYLRDLALDPIERDIKKLMESLASAEKTGVGVLGQEAYVAGLKEALTIAEEKKKTLAKENRYDFGDIAGLSALRRGWKDAQTKSEKESLLKTFFALHGLTGSFGDIVEALGGRRNTSRKIRVTKGAFTTDRSFSNALFMGYLVDLYMEAGLIKKDIIPAELVQVYEEEAEQARLRREAKKAERQAKKAKKNNK